MSSIQIHPIDADVQAISVQLSSLGISERYNLGAHNEWRIDLTQPLGTYSYLEVTVNDAVIYGSPIHTADHNHRNLQYVLEEQQLYPVPASSDTASVQYLWAATLLCLFISLYWSRQ